MRISKQLLLASVAVVGLSGLAACSSDEADADGEATAAGYGECEVYGEAGSIEIEPVNDGILTVQTNLPSPGWWKGETPETTTGGYEYCLAANLAHRAGLDEVRVDNVSFDALVAGQTKDYDIAMAQISVTPEREEVVTFSEPYFDSNIGVLAPADSDISEENIREKLLGIQVGTTSVPWTKEQLDPEQEAKAFQDTTSMVTAVTAGVTDAAIQDTAIMLGFAKNSGGKLEVVGQYETGESYAALYPGASETSDALNEAIAAMKEDGTLDELSATWLGPELGGDPASVPVWTLP